MTTGACGPLRQPPAAAGRRSRRQRRPALAVVAVVYVFFAAAVPAGGARRSHVPHARDGGSSASLLWTSEPPESKLSIQTAKRIENHLPSLKLKPLYEF